MYTIDGIVRDLLQQLKDHSEYNYVSVTDLIHDTVILHHQEDDGLLTEKR